MAELAKPNGSPAPTQIARTNEPGNPAWIKGVSENPADRLRHARERLTSRIVSELAEDWQKHGSEAVARLRETDVAAYVRICVSLVPKELQLDSSPLSGPTKDELAAIAQAARNAIAKADAAAAEQGSSEYSSGLSK